MKSSRACHWKEREKTSPALAMEDAKVDRFSLRSWCEKIMFPRCLPLHHCHRTPPPPLHPHCWLLMKRLWDVLKILSFGVFNNGRPQIKVTNENGDGCAYVTVTSFYRCIVDALVGFQEKLSTAVSIQVGQVMFKEQRQTLDMLEQKF
ncbi:hypothetical protein Tco_1245561 [Tanacetum coccineum]